MENMVVSGLCFPIESSAIYSVKTASPPHHGPRLPSSERSWAELVVVEVTAVFVSARVVLFNRLSCRLACDRSGIPDKNLGAHESWKDAVCCAPSDSVRYDC